MKKGSTVSEETRRKMSESQKRVWARKRALKSITSATAVHINYGHSAREAEPDDRCLYCDRRYAVMAYTYFGAPVCGSCWDRKWRKGEDGACDPPFARITRKQPGEWLLRAASNQNDAPASPRSPAASSLARHIAKAQECKRTVYKTQDGIVLDATRTLVRSDLDEMCDGVITLAARIEELERVVAAARTLRNAVRRDENASWEVQAAKPPFDLALAALDGEEEE